MGFGGHFADVPAFFGHLIDVSQKKALIVCVFGEVRPVFCRQGED
jgi:hypothetical protein